MRYFFKESFYRQQNYYKVIYCSGACTLCAYVFNRELLSMYDYSHRLVKIFYTR